MKRFLAYYTCVFKRCARGEKERCSLRRLLKRCEKTKLNHIYQLGEHLDTYIDAQDSDEEATEYKHGMFTRISFSK